MSRILRTIFSTRKTRFLEHKQNSVKKVWYIVLSLIVIAIPLLSTYTMVTFYLDKKLSDYTPQWSDEIFHWHQAATFRVAGFKGGYYTINEQPAAIPFIHFYAHGPIYPILFGTLGRIIGWEMYYAPLWNIVFLTMAIAWFIKATKPNYLQLLMLGLVMLTFWPTQLFMVTNMRVVIFISIAIVIAAFFYKLIVNPEGVTRLHLVWLCIMIGLMTLFKISWALLFFPYLLLIRKRMQVTVFRTMICTTIILVISYYVYDQIIAPYPYFTSDLLAAMKISLNKALKLFYQHLVLSIRNFFDLSHRSLWLMLRIHMLLAIIGSGYLLWKCCEDETTVRESVVVLTSCGLLLLEAILFFDIFNWRDYRLFAPILLMSIVLFIARKRFILVAIMLVGNLVLFPTFLRTYTELISGAFPEDRKAIEAFSKEIAPIVKYKANKDGWCNTLLTPLPIAKDRLMLGVPAGIGISWFIAPDQLTQIKSRYLLLDKSSYQVLKDRVGLEFKFTTAIGDLYVNQGMRCEK